MPRIRITEAALRRLAALKGKGETLSAVIERLPAPPSARDFVGILSDSAAEELARNLQRMRGSDTMRAARRGPRRRPKA